MKVSIEYSKNSKDKVSVKVEGRDLWNGDVTLARIIYPFLKKYRNLYNGKNPMTGYPATFGPDPLKPEGPDNPDRFNEWLLCLDKMVYSFGWIAKHGDWNGLEVENYYKEYTQVLKPYRKELKKLEILDKQRFAGLKPHESLNSLAWDRQSEILGPIFEKYHNKFEEHRKRIQEGIDLFAKHFGSLWT